MCVLTCSGLPVGLWSGCGGGCGHTAIHELWCRALAVCGQRGHAWHSEGSHSVPPGICTFRACTFLSFECVRYPMGLPPSVSPLLPLLLLLSLAGPLRAGEAPGAGPPPSRGHQAARSRTEQEQQQVAGTAYVVRWADASPGRLLTREVCGGELDIRCTAFFDSLGDGFAGACHPSPAGGWGESSQRTPRKRCCAPARPPPSSHHPHAHNTHSPPPTMPHTRPQCS